MFIRPSKELRRRSRPFFWGTIFILSAVVLLLEGLGIFGNDMSWWWRIILGVILASCLIYVVLFRHFADIFIPLALLYFVFDYPLAHYLMGKDTFIPHWWLVIISAILLTIGFYAIMKPANFQFLFKKPTKKKDDAPTETIGEKLLYLDADKLDGTVIRDHLGAIQLYINNKTNYKGGAVVAISDNIGKIVVHLPEEWDVVTQTGDNLGKINVPTHTGAGEKSITLVISDNLGSIEVLFDDSEKN